MEAVIEPAEPIKDGECGAPAPVRLISIGRNPEVALSPPVTVNCDLVATLASWVKEDLQPLARKHLGAPIVSVRTMSSYSCRNAYGRKSTRLSEHALANAIDVAASEPVTERGRLAGWGSRRVTCRPSSQGQAARRRKIATDKAKTLEQPADEKKPRRKGILTASSGSAVLLPVRKPPTLCGSGALLGDHGSCSDEAAALQQASRNPPREPFASTVSHRSRTPRLMSRLRPRSDDGVALPEAAETACKLRHGAQARGTSPPQPLSLDCQAQYGNYCE